MVEILADLAVVESAYGEIINRDMSMTLAPRKH